MKVSYSWLNELVNLPDEPLDLVELFSSTGTEVEDVIDTGASLSSVVTAKILKKVPHNNADTLWVTKVDVGEEEPLTIVCGAQNFEEGDHVVTAKVGSVLPGDFKIKKSKIRGVTSNGMNCSGRELGVSDDADGILILPEDAPIGVPYLRYAGLADIIYDLEITPNRPDCESVYGVARELGAVLDEPVDLKVPAQLNEIDKNTKDFASVSIEDTERCSRYNIRLISDVVVGESPAWLKSRVEACGARSVNNIVDATNYIMFYLGQPLHAFDFDKVKSNNDVANIGVRAAKDGEKFTTLDDEERTLTHDMTVITADDNPIALAGVMGGKNSEVDDSTTTILLETAVFSNAHTSRTSRNLQLFSEASMRYERGVDPNACGWIAEMAAALIAEVSGGSVYKGAVETYPHEVNKSEITLRMDVCRALIGTDDIANDFAENKLTRLGCEVQASNEPSVFTVQAPTFRPDLTREVDLFEEIVRLYGMEKVPSTIPAAKNHPGGLSDKQKIYRKIGITMRSLGVNEAILYSFAAANDDERLDFKLLDEKGSQVKLINPMSQEQSLLRRTNIPGLLRACAYNQAHGVKNIHLYEQGTLFFGQEDNPQPIETDYLSCVLSGFWVDKSWNTNEQEIDFFDAKGILENLLDELKVQKVRFAKADPEKYPFLHPGRVAEVFAKKTMIGWVGEIHPFTAQDFDINGRVAAFEIDEEALLSVSREIGDYQNVPQFPPVDLDIALVVDEDVTCEKLTQVITSAGGSVLESAKLFDIYRDKEKVGENKKSVTFSLRFRAPDHTLKAKEVNKVYDKIVQKISKATGAEVRR